MHLRDCRIPMVGVMSVQGQISSNDSNPEEGTFGDQRDLQSI